MSNSKRDEDELSQNTTTTILAAGRESAVRTVRKRTTDRIMSMIHTFDKGWKYVSAEKKAKQEDKIRREAFEEASKASQIDESNMMSNDDMRKLLLGKLYITHIFCSFLCETMVWRQKMVLFVVSQQSG